MDASAIHFAAKAMLFGIALLHSALGLFLIYVGLKSDIREVNMSRLDEGSKIPVIAGIVLNAVAIIMATATYFA